jgi:hypothetical protein
MYELTQYEKNKLTLSRFFPKEISDIILRLKTDAETEDARFFYYQHRSVFNMENYYHRYAYDTFLTEINECIKILNTPNFWEKVLFDQRGYVSGTKFIETYSDDTESKRLNRISTDPIYQGELHKIDLLNREFFTIHSLWTQHRHHPYHNICLQFIADYIISNGVTRKRWVLYN